MKCILMKTKINPSDGNCLLEYFKGYEGEGKAGNRPTWTKHISQAVEYTIEVAMRLKNRLFWQSQFVELIPVGYVEVWHEDENENPDQS